jgi:hypothetical protein
MEIFSKNLTIINNFLLKNVTFDKFYRPLENHTFFRTISRLIQGKFSVNSKQKN